MKFFLIMAALSWGTSWASVTHLTNQLIQGMTGESHRQTFDVRAKQLSNLEALIGTENANNSKVYSVFRRLLKEYQSQYLLLKKQHVSRGKVSADADAKLRQAKMILRELSRARNISPSLLNQAVDCHEVFSALENMLEDNTGRVGDHSEVGEISSTPSEIAIMYGERDHLPQKKVRRPDADEIPEYKHVIVVSQSVGIEHGIDKLIDRE